MDFIDALSSASNRIIHAKDHGAIQLTLAEVDETTGRATGAVKHYAICGEVRKWVSYQGKSSFRAATDRLISFSPKTGRIR
jgi:hypothetical protein